MLQRSKFSLAEIEFPVYSRTGGFL